MTFTATIFNIDVTGTQTADVNDNLAASHIHAGPAVTPTTNGRRVGLLRLAVQRQQPERLRRDAVHHRRRRHVQRQVGPGRKATTRPSPRSWPTSSPAAPTSTSTRPSSAAARSAATSWSRSRSPRPMRLMLAGLAVVAGVARRRGRSERAPRRPDRKGRETAADRPAGVRTGRPCRPRRAPASTARSSAR